MNVNIEIVFLDFLKIDFLDLGALRFGRQYRILHLVCLNLILFHKYAILYSKTKLP